MSNEQIIHCRHRWSLFIFVSFVRFVYIIIRSFYICVKFIFVTNVVDSMFAFGAQLLLLNQAFQYPMIIDKEKYHEFKFSNHVVVILTAKELLQEDSRLIKIYGFKSSNLLNDKNIDDRIRKQTKKNKMTKKNLLHPY